MAIKPLRDCVVVKAITQEEKTKSGIVLPDTAAKEKPEQGKVIACGPKIKDIKKGDIIIFESYSPTEIKVDNEDFLVIKEENILAIIVK